MYLHVKYEVMKLKESAKKYKRGFRGEKARNKYYKYYYKKNRKK